MFVRVLEIYSGEDGYHKGALVEINGVHQTGVSMAQLREWAVNGAICENFAVDHNEIRGYML